MATTNVVTGVVAGEYGLPIIVTLVDEDNSAIDVSSYNGTKQIILARPNGRGTNVTLTGSFTTDGTDGKVQGTPADGEIDVPGDWKGQVVLNKTGVKAKTVQFKMVVEGALS